MRFREAAEKIAPRGDARETASGGVSRDGGEFFRALAMLRRRYAFSSIHCTVALVQLPPLRRFSFALTFSRCVSTVFALIPNLLAICCVVMPRPIMRKTSIAIGEAGHRVLIDAHAADPLQEVVGHPRAEVDFALEHAANGGDHFVDRLLLVHVPLVAGQGPLRIGLFVESGPDERLHVGIDLPQLGDHLDPGTVLERDVDDHEVRAEGLRLFEGFGDALRPAAGLDVRLVVDDRASP